MKKNTLKKLFITCLTVISLFCIVSVSFAEENDADALKEQISSIESQIEQLESEKAELQAQLNELEGDNEDTDSGNSQEEVEIVEDYTYNSGRYNYHFLVVKNNTEEDVGVSSESFAYGEDGSMVAYGDGDLVLLGAGCTSIIVEWIETEEEIASYDTTIKVNDSGYYAAVIQDLSYVENDISGGAIFQVTNNGEYAADFVEGYALFLLDGELVDYEYSYFTDGDSEIKPGDTISNQFNTSKDFDTIEFYLTGERHAH